MADVWMTPPSPTLLSGREPISGTGATINDFWSWALSDLRANIVRSLLAEYLVAGALGVVHRPRIEWDACDITIPEGRIEVKAGGYIQAWDQRALSKVVFSGLKARTWTPAARHSAEATYNADAYVFAVVTAIDHDTYNALDTEGWQFWVLPASVVASTNQASMALSRVQTLCTSPIGYEELAAAIRAALANAKD